MKKKLIAVTLLSAFFVMPNIANAVVDTQTYVSYDNELVPATRTGDGSYIVSNLPDRHYLKRTGYPWDPFYNGATLPNSSFCLGAPYVGCITDGYDVQGIVAQGWAQENYTYTCADGSTPNNENKCLVQSTVGKFKTSAVFERVRDFVGNLLPAIITFLVLGISISLAIKATKKYSKNLKG